MKVTYKDSNNKELISYTNPCYIPNINEKIRIHTDFGIYISGFVIDKVVHLYSFDKEFISVNIIIKLD